MPNTSAVTMLMPKPGEAVIDSNFETAYVGGQDSPSAVKGVKIYGVPGRIVRQWTWLFDAAQILNVDNEVVTPDKVYDAVEDLATEHLLVTVVDNTGSVWRDESETVTAKIEDITLQKIEPSGNWIVRIVATEVV